MLPRKPPRTKPLPSWALSGQELTDLTNPTDLNNPAAVIAACCACMKDKGSETPLLDVKWCAAFGGVPGTARCGMWNPRRKALEVIEGKRKKM